MDNRKFLQELRELTRDAQLSNRAKELAMLVPKWERTGLLEGYDAISKLQLVGLLQNEAIQVRKTINEVTDTTDIAGFNKIAFPLVKKIFDKIIASEIVSFQTMTLPSGLIFFQDFRFETSQPGFTSGNSVFQDLNTSVSGMLGGRGAALSTGGFYDNKHWYSNNWMNRASLALTAVDSDTIVVPWASLTGIGAGADESKPLYIANVPLQFESWSGSNAMFTIINNDPTTTTTTASLTSQGGTGLTSATIYYVPQTDVTYRGDFESSTAIPSLDMKISNIPVSAQTRKLKTSWTQEGAQDLMAYHGVDAEVELTAKISDMVSLEINNNILGDLLGAGRASGNSDYWSARLGNYVDSSGTTLTGIGVGSTGVTPFHGTQREWNETLVNKMTKASNKIYKKTFVGKANKVVVSPDVATILESTLQWKVVEDGNGFGAGIEKSGTLNNKMTVYTSASFPTNKILLAHKGTDWLTTGYVYAPYVLLYMTPTVFDPSDFTPRKMLMTRDARKVVKPEYFAQITVSGMEVI